MSVCVCARAESREKARACVQVRSRRGAGGDSLCVCDTSVHWMRPGLEVDSIRLAVFIVSPSSVYLSRRALAQLQAEGGLLCEVGVFSAPKTSDS